MHLSKDICISETFDGIKIHLIFENENAFDPIVCKLEFGEISTFVRFLHSENAYDEMILIFDGIEISLMSRLANKSLSNSSLFGSLLPIKYLLSINLNWPLDGEIIIFVKFLVSKHHSSFNSFKLGGK